MKTQSENWGDWSKFKSKTDCRWRLLHDLADIELQAVELCYRGWQEYPEVTEEFREFCQAYDGIKALNCP
ncbi:MAG: hypothetical protein C5B49_05160 [Bdellovibrio sp.]|nr:MAG: hypothetical protein C5B49_05160 [Bdellovibrio sp.]